MTRIRTRPLLTWNGGTHRPTGLADDDIATQAFGGVPSGSPGVDGTVVFKGSAAHYEMDVVEERVAVHRAMAAADESRGPALHTSRRMISMTQSETPVSITLPVVGGSLVLAVLGLALPGCADDDPESEGTTHASLAQSDAAGGRAGRLAEVAQYLAAWHEARGHRILRTVTDPTGDVVDIVAAETVEGSQVPQPAPPADVPAPGVDRLPEPGRDGASDPAVVRFVRPGFSRYVDGIDRVASFDAYLELVERSHGTPQPPGVPPGAPCTNNCQRLYAGSFQSSSNRGADSWVNGNWSPGQVDSGTFFLAQTNVIDFNTSLTTNAEWIGWIIGRNPALYDSSTRVMSEFYTAGTNNTGNYVGGWANLVSGFVPVAGAGVALGDLVTGVSTVGGNQYDHRMVIEYFPAANQPCGYGCTGSWWLLYDSGWVGYFPVGSLWINFDRIWNSAPTITWYGEVFDPTPGTWTATDMGSAQYASSTSNWQQAGYFRMMSYKNASNNTWYWSTAAQVLDNGNDDPACYTRWETYYTDPAWRTTMYLGGPGRTATNGCDPF